MIQQAYEQKAQSLQDEAEQDVSLRQNEALASAEIEKIVDDLKMVRLQQERLKRQEEELKQAIFNYLKDKEVLVNEHKDELVSWKYTSEVVFFDAKKFQKENPGLYEAYLDIKDGSRRFLVKG